MLLTAAPQDGSVYLTWNPVDGAAGYTVGWREAGSAAAREVDTQRRYALVTGLQNGATYEFQVSASGGAGVVRSSAWIPAVPRERPGCAWNGYMPWDRTQSVFCTTAAMEEWMEAAGIVPEALSCRGRVVAEWSPLVPDCIYYTPAGDKLVLLRTADSVFSASAEYPRPADVRTVARQLIWRRGHPFGSTTDVDPLPIAVHSGGVTAAQSVRAFEVPVNSRLSSRVTWFTPPDPIPGRYAIYHEGHGGAAVDIAATTIDWLLARGWRVIALDMPIAGLNGPDIRPDLALHGDLAQFDDGRTSPLSLFMTPIQAVVDRIIADGVREGSGFAADVADPDILLIGRSGGGWASYMYGALDPRIDVVVSAAGGLPISRRLDAPWLPADLTALELGDYEQIAPHFYSVIGHEDLMLAAGTRGALYLFNEHDPCCFRVEPEGEFVSYLRQGASVLGKPVDVFVDPDHREHSIGPASYVVMDAFLDRIFP